MRKCKLWWREKKVVAHTPSFCFLKVRHRSFAETEGEKTSMEKRGGKISKMADKQSGRGAML